MFADQGDALFLLGLNCDKVSHLRGARSRFVILSHFSRMILRRFFRRRRRGRPRQPQIRFSGCQFLRADLLSFGVVFRIFSHIYSVLSVFPLEICAFEV
jgi:hypothetical protein